MQIKQLPLIALALFTAAAPSLAQGRRVDTAPVTRQDLQRELKLVGGTEPWQKTTLFSRVEGYIATISAERGDILNMGDAVAILDVPDLHAAADSARAAVDEGLAGVANAEAMISKAEADVTVAQSLTELRIAEVMVSEAELALSIKIAERVRELHSKGAATDKQLDEAGGALEMAEAQLEASRAAAGAARASAGAKYAEVQAAIAATESALAVTRSAQASLAQAEVRIGFASLINPYPKALVTARHVDAGALVRAGATPVVELADVSQLRLFFDVPEPDAPFVKTGTGLTLNFDAFPRTPIEATIARTAGSLNARTRTMQAEVVIDNSDGAFMPGMYCHAKLTLLDHPKALTVPGSAIYVRGGETWVLVAEGAKARRAAVVVGMDDGRVVEILSGLKGTERVILGRPTGLSDGDAIEMGAKKS
jgi:RND family efflux transporter MFP subunit